MGPMKDPDGFSHGNPCDFTIVARATDHSQVHALDSKGGQVLIRFDNGFLPSFEINSVITVWDPVVKTVGSGLEVLEIDLQGPCRWVRCLPQSVNETSKMNYAELFAGLGGWTRGLQAMNSFPKVLVECDKVVADACAVSLGLQAIKASDLYDNLCRGIRPIECVIVGDLTDPKVWSLLSYYDLHMICMSPPCQPWSKAARETGLDVKDGQAFAVVFQYSPKIGIKIINVENVGNIMQHPHFPTLMNVVKTNGFQVLHSGIYDVHPFLPIKRERWLAAFGNSKIPVLGSVKESANKVKFPSISFGLSTLLGRDCVQKNFEDKEWEQLLPCPDAILKLSNPELFPRKFVKHEGSTIYQSRINDGSQCMGGAMAMYGRQHCLPMDLLKQKGLFTTLIAIPEQGNIPRYFTAWEILACMAWPMDTVLPSDKNDAWHAAGNAICIPHTILCLFKTHGVLQDASPFGNVFYSLKKLCVGVFNRSIKLSGMIPCTLGDLKKLRFVQDNDEGGVQDTPASRVRKSFADSPFISPDRGEPRSNPFARVHGIQQGSPTRESFPFMSVGSEHVSHGNGHESNPNDGFQTPNRSVIQHEPSDGLGLTEELIRNFGVDGCKLEKDSVEGQDVFQMKLATIDTVIDIESDEEEIQPQNLDNVFLDVASKEHGSTLIRKRIIHDDDTWGYNLTNEGAFYVIDQKDVEASFRLTSIKQAEDMLRKALHKTGINRIWPMVRDIIVINPVDKWACVTLVAYGETVIDMIRAVLPHAKPSHFKAVRVNDQTVVPQSIPPGHCCAVIMFLPVLAECRVTLDDGCIVKCAVDVTTTVKDLKTQLHIKTGLCTEVMILCHESIKLKEWDFVCHCNTPELKLTTDARVQIPGDIPPASSKLPLVMPPSHSDIMIPSTVDMVRFVVRHPIWSTVRTVACSVEDTIDVMLKKLIPDMVSTCDLTMRNQDSGIMNDLQIKHINMTGIYEIVFGCTKPIPVARVEIIPFNSIDDQMEIGVAAEGSDVEFVKVWVRSPFQTKVYEKSFPKDMTMQYLAGSYFAHSQSSQCVMVILDGKLIDPRTKMHMIDCSKVLTFRAAPILGGGKEKDKDVKKILFDQFQARGVPQDLLSSRVDGFLAKISADKVRTHSGETWARQWVSIKGLANEAHFRLITADELRAFQNKKKSEKHVDNVSSASTKSSAGTSVSQRAPSDKSAKQLNLTEIRLDLSYFKAGETTLKQLSSESFGPDGCGITVMHVDSAMKFLPVKRLSADPLAIVTVGNKSITDQGIRMAPATNSKNEPILVPFTILNYGDAEVRFHAGEMTADLTTQNAIVVEFTIIKDEVENWQDARSALVYLGQKIGETKTSKVLSSWAIKSYTKDRKQCNHHEAEYIHGFLRVLESQADPLLSRSGWYGIYLIPKNSMKKPHESYSIVAIPGKTIDEMQAIVQSTKNALGIVRTSNALAVRCRREHTFSIKKLIFPELPLQEEGSFEAGDKLYILKHLESHTNTGELTSALRSVGWSGAKALKPIGPTAWSIAAPADPPAAHICLNNTFVVVMPQGRSNGMVSLGVKVPPTAAFVADTKAVPIEESTTSRMDELKMDLKQDLQGQVQALVDAKFQESKQEIVQLKQSMGHAKESIEQIKIAQANTEKKVHEVESAIKSSSDNLLSKLSGMFGDLQNNISRRLDKLENRQGENEEREVKKHKP